MVPALASLQTVVGTAGASGGAGFDSKSARRNDDDGRTTTFSDSNDGIDEVSPEQRAEFNELIDNLIQPKAVEGNPHNTVFPLVEVVDEESSDGVLVAKALGILPTLPRHKVVACTRHAVAEDSPRTSDWVLTLTGMSKLEACRSKCRSAPNLFL